MHPGAHAAADPDRPALVVEPPGTVVTYGGLDRSSLRLANLFHSRGLGVADAVALWLDNTPEFLETAWAAQRSGLVYTPLSPQFTAAEAAYVLADCGARAIVTSHDRRGAAPAAVAGLPELRTRLMAGGTVDGFEPYEPLVSAQPPDRRHPALEGHAMLYSSGTTGRPKGVRRRRAQVALGTPGFDTTLGLGRLLYGYGDDTVLLSPGPLYHAAPLWFTMAVQRAGGTAVVMRHFDPLAFLGLIERHRVTHVLMVPTMFVRLLKLAAGERDRFDLSSLRYCIHGAAPCPPAVKERMIRWWGPILHEYYAGTERNGFVACDSAAWLAHRGTVGRAVGGPVVHIVGEDGSELPAGAIGDVYLEGGPDFEYHNDPDKTRAAHHPDGWTTLGDLGYLDDDGFLYLTDRRGYTIISGGVNVYPREVEDVLVGHDAVLDAAVFGVPHEELGEQVKAVVQPVEPAEAGPDLEAALIAWCRRELAPFKCPRSVDFVTALPRSAAGKLRKGALRARYWPPADEAGTSGGHRPSPTDSGRPAGAS